MSPSLAETLDVIDALWPSAGAEAWDAPGPVSGDPAAPVTRLRLVVDAVAATVDEAIDDDVDLIVAHHPLLLRGATSIAEDRYKGALIARLIRAGCALVTAHTNADVAPDGVSDVIAQRLGLLGVRPILAGAAAGSGIGRVGTLSAPTTLGSLARELAGILPPTASGVRVSGDFAAPVATVALCGGAGDAYLSEPAVRASDVYITSDLRHHPASAAREQALLGGGPALIDVSHWASEWLWLETAAAQLRDALPGVEVTVSELRTDPWDFAIMQ
jgi:dinuclear metal center YbgI/SA1388 family protein